MKTRLSNLPAQPGSPCLRWLLICLICLMSPYPSLAAGAKGNDNPTLAFNVGGTADWVGGMQFLDIAKTMRPWIGHKPGQWGGMKYEDLRAGGFIDAHGWVTDIPESLSHVGTIWQWSSLPDAAEYRIGIYVLTYSGNGTLSISGDVQIIQQRPGRIVFANRKGQNMYLSIKETDPDGTGDYIRDISIIPEKYADLYAAGGRFNPEWLRHVENARVLRFMNWTRTNNAPRPDWASRPTPKGLFSGRGIPLELIVQLANEVGADPWFTMPHLADEAYIRAFATYIRDHLDPRLTIFVEYSNETWNRAFEQAKWLDRQAEEEWGKADNHAYHTKKATEVALLWNAVFGPAAAARLTHVLGTQAVNRWATEQRLEARTWRQKEPQSYHKPEEIFNALAVTHYFGTTIVTDAELRHGLIAAIRDPDVDAARYLAAKLSDPDIPSSIPAVERALRQQADLARRHGMRPIAYEGGQHVHHSFAVRDLSKDDVDTLTGFMTDFVRSTHMADLYRASWASWTRVGQGPFMQFTDMSTPSKWGSWGLRRVLNEDVPRAAVLDRRNARTNPWWEAQGGVHYQQGVTRIGDASGNRLRGTDAEDYLLGRGGDDILLPGQGNDGIHGGPGTDRVSLQGQARQYHLRQDGEAYILEGPTGRKRLIDVEILQFADTGPLQLSKLPMAADDSMTLGTD